MARSLRIAYPNAVYHVMSRGNQRQEIVRDNADRLKRLDWLRRTVKMHGWRLHAFVLMDNHEHLFVQTPEPNLSAGMRLLNSGYTGYFNRRHRQVGHLFQGRFKGHLVEEESYFLEVSRYIHLNPVRAKLVQRPEQYRWSSFPGYRRAKRTLPWVTYAQVLGEFGRDMGQARRAYSRFVQAAVEKPPPSPFADAVEGLLLGSKSFVDRVRQMLDKSEPDAEVPQLRHLQRRPSLDDILNATARTFQCNRSDWALGCRCDAFHRSVAAYVARRLFGYPAIEVSAALGYAGASSVSHAVKRIEKSKETRKAKKDLLAKLDKVERQLR